MINQIIWKIFCCCLHEKKGKDRKDPRIATIFLNMRAYSLAQFGSYPEATDIRWGRDAVEAKKKKYHLFT